MTVEKFLEHLQEHANSFAKAVATNEGEWIIKGFIDIYRKIYTISVDTKIVSKVLELLLFPMFVEFSRRHGLRLELCPQQNFYPDLTFTHQTSGTKFAVDIKSTYRTSATEVNGMTLGASRDISGIATATKTRFTRTASIPGILSWESSTRNATRLQMSESNLRWRICLEFPLSSGNLRFLPNRNFGLRPAGPGVGTRKILARL